MSSRQGWIKSVQLLGPQILQNVEVPSPGDLGPDEVEVRLELAGICGSDKPGFIHGVDKIGERPVGFPTHECVGTVVRSSGDQSLVGKRVIAIPNRDAGLGELFHAPIFKTHVLTSDLPMQTVILAQPLATVLAALDRLGDVTGKNAAVLGLGPIGISFGYVLRSMGVASLAGFDLADRTGAPFTELFDSIGHIPAEGQEFDIVVEAVGHDLEVVNTAIEATAYRGTALFFGVPDDDIYPFKFKRFFRKCLTMVANVQPHWLTYLPRAENFLVDHPDLGAIVTDVVPVQEAHTAFETAFVNPRPDRGKVLISVDAWTGAGAARAE
ncbi:alcohol dehydrogenase catalytic domain-containing protein [Propionicimonas sp. T2.31MG-18]|uniref:alcohol dehydrogenase catalytic domain-containing protein n=1 Tax=Propionicimonas sp. T2.31MG-18 TaxID=3157620 RepID=UPI00366D6767